VPAGTTVLGRVQQLSRVRTAMHMKTYKHVGPTFGQQHGGGLPCCCTPRTMCAMVLHHSHEAHSPSWHTVGMHANAILCTTRMLELPGVACITLKLVLGLLLLLVLCR
jgi:hypothetical protein